MILIYSGIEVKPEEKRITIELSEPPAFSAKERGKNNKVTLPFISNTTITH